MKNIKAIFIVAGHSVYNPGASYKGLSERSLAITIATNLADNLSERTNIKTFLVGVNEELALKEKIKKINNICARNGYDVENSLLISVHVNAGKGTGLEAYSYNDFVKGKGFSTKLLKGMQESTELKIRGAKYEKLSQYKVLGIVHETTPLASLVECGFIDTTKDRKVLKNNPIAFSKGIFNGLKSYIGFTEKKLETNLAGKIKLLEKENDLKDEIIKTLKGRLEKISETASKILLISKN